MQPDGYIKIKDRAKDIIISGGENISSLEVEDALYRHPAVLAAAVVAQPDPKWGETPCAFVEIKTGRGGQRSGAHRASAGSISRASRRRSRSSSASCPRPRPARSRSSSCASVRVRRARSSSRQGRQHEPQPRSASRVRCDRSMRGGLLHPLHHRVAVRLADARHPGQHLAEKDAVGGSCPATRTLSR